MHPSPAPRCSSALHVLSGPSWSASPPVPTTVSDQFRGTPALGGSLACPCTRGDVCKASCVSRFPSDSDHTRLCRDTACTHPYLCCHIFVTGAPGPGASLCGLGTAPGCAECSGEQLGLCSRQGWARFGSLPCLSERRDRPSAPKDLRMFSICCNHRNHRGTSAENELTWI